MDAAVFQDKDRPRPGDFLRERLQQRRLSYTGFAVDLDKARFCQSVSKPLISLRSKKA
jgi:hypothetical protein